MKAFFVHPNCVDVSREVNELACVGATLKSELAVDAILDALSRFPTPPREARLIALTKNMMLAYSEFRAASLDVLGEINKLTGAE